MSQNKLDLYDTKLLKDIRSNIKSIYEYNLKSIKDPLSEEFETILKKIDHIIEEYGEQDL